MTCIKSNIQCILIVSTSIVNVPNRFTLTVRPFNLV